MGTRVLSEDVLIDILEQEVLIDRERQDQVGPSTLERHLGHEHLELRVLVGYPEGLEVVLHQLCLDAGSLFRSSVSRQESDVALFWSMELHP